MNLTVKLKDYARLMRLHRPIGVLRHKKCEPVGFVETALWTINDLLAAQPACIPVREAAGTVYDRAVETDEVTHQLLAANIEIQSYATTSAL